MSDTRTAIVYEFGAFRLDPARRLLFGSNGASIPLKPKVFDTLLYFVEHAGELLDKTQLMKAIWGGVIVEENSLNQHISALRRVFGESPGENRFIVTVPGRGYRFVAALRVGSSTVGTSDVAAGTPAIPAPGPHQAQSVAKAGRNMFVAAAAAIVAALAIGGWILHSVQPGPKKTIAVLPLDNQSPDPANGFFARGVHDELIRQLSNLGSVDVIGRTSVLAYADGARSIPEIAAALGVDAIVEGSVYYADGDIRVSARLVSGRTGKTLWNDSYERQSGAGTGLLEIESDIAMKVANALDAALSPRQMAALQEHPPTNNAHAYELYLYAIDYERREGLVLPIAADLYRRAVTEDPQFALAWARLSRVSTQIHEFGVDANPQWLAEAHDAGQRALELQPELPEAHVAMAYYYLISARSYESALAELGFVSANAQNTPDFFAARSTIYEAMGNWERAFADSGRAVQLDPRNVMMLNRDASLRIETRRYDDAERLYDRALDVAPDSAYAQFGKASVLLMRDGDYSALKEQRRRIYSGDWPAGAADWFGAWFERDYDAALALIDHAGNLDTWGAALVRGMTQELAGRHDLANVQFEMARDGIQSELDALPSGGRRRGELLGVLGYSLAALGKTEAALQATREALDDLGSVPAPIAYNLRLLAVRVYIMTGDLESAFAELDEYLANPGDWSIEALRLHPQLDAIHGDPRFLALYEKYRRR